MQHIPAQAEPLQCRRTNICNDRIANLCQFQERGFALRIFQIQHQTALVAIGVKINPAHILVAHRRNMPRGIARMRFHLDHIRAQIAQYLRRKRPHDDGAHVDNA